MRSQQWDWLRGPSGVRVGGEGTVRGEEQCETADPAPPLSSNREKVRDADHTADGHTDS